MVFLGIPFWGKTQDSVTCSIGADVQYHPQDFFFHVRGQFLQKRLAHEVFLGFGINTTIFQGQFKPAVGYDISYRSRLIDWITISPLIRFSYSVSSTKIPEKHPFIHLTESFLGCRLDFGIRNRVAVTGGIGPGIEWKYDAYQERNNHFWMWNYFFEIGYYHEF